jgi:hypothetical protein
MSEITSRLSVLVIVLVIFYVISDNMVNNDAVKYYESRRLRGKTRPKIYDIGHKYIQDLTATPYAKYMCDALGIMSTMVAYFAFSVAAFSELMALQISIFIFRFVTINLTVLPPVHPDDAQYSLYKFFLDNVYDHQFSGHMAYVITALLVVLKYKMTWLVLPAVIVNIVMAVLLIASRAHYTIDIVMSIIVCLFFMLFGIKAKI